MSRIDMTCPEDANSTDCLLRVLLDFLEKKAKDNDEKFDWDPVTFGFTAPVGILAAVFGLISIIVATIAAGPGRRKSSALAIGEWSTLTSRKWDWSGLTWESTAATPLLTIANVKEVLKRGAAKNNDNGNNNNYNSGNILSLYTLADYLPADILGAPACGEVGFIITAMTCAGDSFESASDRSSYPVIIGNGFQFDFREHPILGTVGAFSHHRPPKSQGLPPQPPSPRQMQHAEGKVDVSKLLRQPGQPRATVTETEINAISLSSPKHLLETVHGNCNNQNKLCSMKALFSRGDDHHLLWLLVGEAPDFPPAIFPATAASERDLLSALALSSKFWSMAWPSQKFES
ncbi:hypothetical protein GGR55DRAFT_703640 [Xylaria sp. FL0064]|nr:hypothetical protein GGR55DRAFT_703640 [Xylaria sp. FL0064]